MWWVVVVDQAITDPISGPSLSFVFCLLSIGPELDNKEMEEYLSV